MPSDHSNLDLLSFLTLYLATDTSTFEEQARAIAELIVIAWGIHVVNWGVAGGGLCWVLGVRPRELSGLPGIFFAPFLHGVGLDRDGEPDNGHIIWNTIFFAPLGFFIALQGLKLFYVVSIICLLASGLGTWLFGKEGTTHVGASGVIDGYIGFLLIYGLVSRNPLAFFLGLVTLLIYGRTVNGILPDDPKTSWEGHLFGFIGGIFAAYLVSYVRVNYLVP